MQIFLSVWREFYRQKANLFFAVFFPSILVFILGTLLEQWNVSEVEIPAIRVGYVAEEEYPAFEQFLSEMEKEEMLKTVREQNLQTALEKMGTDYSAVLLYDAEKEQLVLHRGKDQIINNTLQILLEGYASMEQAVMISYENGVPFTMEAGAPTEFVTAKKLGVERSMMDYYGVCMLVMILVMGGTISTATALYEFRKSGLFNRVAVTPAGKMKTFLFMVLGNMPMVAIEIGAIMLCSVFIYGGHYCADIKGNIVLILFFAIVGLTMEAFGAVIGLLVNVNPTGILVPLCWTMMFFSGTFAKDIFIDGLSQRMPVYLVQQAAFDLTVFGNYGRVFTVGAGSLLGCIVFLMAGAVIFRVKKER